MVQSRAKTVDAYMAEFSSARGPYLEKVRAIARRVLVHHDERMQWGMPAYFRQGKADFAFASQKQYLALYVMKAGVHALNADALSRLDCGKGCIRFRNPRAIDWTLVEKLLVDTGNSDEAPCQV